MRVSALSNNLEEYSVHHPPAGVSGRLDVARRKCPSLFHVTVQLALDDIRGRDQVIERIPEGQSLCLGRYSRSSPERDQGKRKIQLIDREPYNVSRLHCKIEVVEGGVLVRDCQSHLGTWVNGTRIGVGAASMVALLKEGRSEIILGNLQSPHRIGVAVANLRG